MNNNTLIIGLLTLLIGLVIGLALGGSGFGGGMMNMMGLGGMMRGGSMEMEEAMHGMTENLEGLSGDEFDRAFIAEMIVHHEGAVDMARAALESAKHDEIKQMAEDIISAQTREIEQMKNWQRDWYGE